MLRLTVFATVRTSHVPTHAENLRAFRESPRAAACEPPEAHAAPQGLDAADAWPSVVPCSWCLFAVAFRAVGRDQSDRERGSSKFCGSATSPGARTNPISGGAGFRVTGYLRISRGNIRGGGLRSLFWRDGFAQRRPALRGREPQQAVRAAY